MTFFSPPTFRSTSASSSHGELLPPLPPSAHSAYAMALTSTGAALTDYGCGEFQSPFTLSSTAAAISNPSSIALLYLLLHQPRFL
ncbi:hypothetical protein F2Q68_00015084 [Brassica cretica]|uniref:Uncharacterized protein n=1 Tax=Brassica cretica TaxID=69181 RepID=A0A8S9HFU6_BRACR|nr:hypothetical protein F2Q68_00015084 [Brassica cretica]